MRSRARPVRLREGPASDFTRGSEGQGIQHHKGRRDHPLRQAFSQELVHLTRGGTALSHDDEIRDQALLPTVILPGDHDGFPDRGKQQERRLDLRDLDPLTADLHLEVLASQLLDATIGQHTAQVAGAVDAPVRTARVRREGSARQFRIPPVPQGEIGTPDGQLADAVEAEFTPGFIKHNDLRAVDCVADRDHRAVYRSLFIEHVLPCTVELGRAKPVDEEATIGKVPLVELDIRLQDGLPA